MLKRLKSNLTGIAFWVGLVIAIAALWLTGILEDAWNGLRGAELIPLIFVVCAGIVLPIIHAWRWKVVMRSLDQHLSIGEASEITVSSALLNYASPGFVGASAKALLANQTRSIPYRLSALAIAFEHTLDLGMMALTSLVVILIIGPSAFSDVTSPLQGLTALIVIGAVIGIAVVGLVVAWRLGALRKVREMMSSAGQMGRQVNRSEVIALSILYLLLQILVVALLFWALGIPMMLIDIVAIATVPILAGMLAPVPGGVGVREAVIVALATVTVATPGELLTLAIIQRVLLVAALPLALAIVRLVRRFAVRFA